MKKLERQQFDPDHHPFLRQQSQDLYPLLLSTNPLSRSDKDLAFSLWRHFIPKGLSSVPSVLLAYPAGDNEQGFT